MFKLFNSTPRGDNKNEDGLKKEEHSDVSEKLQRAARISLMAGLAFLGTADLGKGSQRSETPDGKNVEMVSDTQKKASESHWGIGAIPNFEVTFFERGEDGNMKFNPWSLLAPVQVEVSKNVNEGANASFQIPYQYSRLFNTGKPLRPEDHEKLAKYIEQELRRQMVDTLHGLDVSKRVYHVVHQENISNTKINSIKVTGTASPEGPEIQGGYSLEIGNVDEENIELALIRAEEGLGLTAEQLLKMGISKETLIKSLKEMRGEEIQFSRQEMDMLSLLAAGMPGDDNLEKIFNLIVKYNDSGIKDEQALQQLDKIIGSKRTIQVNVEYEGDHKEVFMLPIPWLIIFLPKLRKFWPPWRKNPPRTKPPVPPEIQNPPKQPQIPEKIRTVLPPVPGTPEREEIEERTLLDDLFIYFDNPETISNGLNYRYIIEEMEKNHNNFQSDTERAEYLTNIILEAWRIHDITCRKNAGISEDQLEVGLDYINQEQQIIWARVHAEIMLDIIKIHMSDPYQTDYADIINDKSKQIRQKQLQGN